MLENVGREHFIAVLYSPYWFLIDVDVVAKSTKSLLE